MMVLVIPKQGKKAPERRSGLRPSEKELPEWLSGAFRHHNTPGFKNMQRIYLAQDKPAAGFCEYKNELSGSVKETECLDRLEDC
jgi:hypothetical protein